MLNAVSRRWIVGGVWLATLIAIVGFSVSMGAALSTTVLVFALGVSPAIVMLVIGAGAPSPTVAQMLHSVRAKDGR